MQRAVGHLFKRLKKKRRLASRAAVNEADRQVVAATATGSPDRIDDETAGIPIKSEHRRRLRRHAHQGAAVLHLQAALHRSPNAFYHQLCPNALPPAAANVMPALISPADAHF